MNEYGKVKVSETNNAFDVFALLQKTPERYLSDPNIYALQDFINGYLTGNPYPKGEPPFWSFKFFLMEKSTRKPEERFITTISEILLAECGGDKYRAYDRFFEYLEMYKNQESSQP